MNTSNEGGLHGLKIAMVLSSAALGGMEMRSARLAQLGLLQGYGMHYGCRQGSKLEAELQGSGVKLFNCHIHGSLDVWSGIRLARYLQKEKIQILMAFSGSEYWASICAAKLTGIPVILSRSTATPLNIFTARFARNADCMLAVSQGIKSLLLKQGIPGKKIEVIYNGLDTDAFFAGRLPARDLLRGRFGIPQDKFVIGCLARAEKGQTLLLSLDPEVRKRHSDVHYYFAGQNIPERLGPFLHAQPQLAAHVTLKEMIPYEDVPAVLHALDAVVMLPETEPFSNAVIEAMALEKPMILSKTVGNIDAVTDGASGLLVDIGDTDSIIRAVLLLRENPQLACKMGQAARERALRLFSQDAMLDGYERLWHRLSDRKRCREREAASQENSRADCHG